MLYTKILKTCFNIHNWYRITNLKMRYELEVCFIMGQDKVQLMHDYGAWPLSIRTHQVGFK